MDKRTLLAVVISIGILLLYQIFFAPSPSVTPIDNNSTISSVDNAPKSITKEITITNKTSTPKHIETVKISNGYINIFFNKQTGDITSASVVNYRDKKLPVITFKSIEHDYLQILNGLSDNYSMEIKESENEKVVIFKTYKENLGIIKSYTLNKDSYIVKVDVKISNNSDQTIKFDGNIKVGAGLGEGFEKSSYIFEGAMLYNGKDKIEISLNKADKDVSINDPKWVGFTSKYYLFAVIDGNLNSAKIEKYNNLPLIKGIKQYILNPNSVVNTQFNLFIGPKEYDLLKSYQMGLEHSIDFGWFKFLAIPMLKFMLFINKFTHNYGVAIILLTIVVKILTYPLTIKSMTSMKKMQTIQPKLMEIREKFKNDPQKMNTAMMDLYRKHGVNPMGGCLPMLIQIPIFFALYKALLVSVELKGSPFIFWITDLAEKDPYYITPIIMGITMFIQQKMTPSTMDPMQQKIFLLMPIIFTFLFLNFPAGLVIYWLTNNILSIAQQYYINKKLS